MQNDKLKGGIMSRSTDVIMPLASVFTAICVIIIIIAIIQIPARIASKKGHSFIGFLVFAIFFYPFALIVALLIGDKTSYSSEADKAEALTKYKKLLDEGSITQEEFDKKKKEYL